MKRGVQTSSNQVVAVIKRGGESKVDGKVLRLMIVTLHEFDDIIYIQYFLQDWLVQVEFGGC